MLMLFLILLGFWTDVFNLTENSKMVSPIPEPTPHAIHLLVDDQDLRLRVSAMERAVCLKSGECEWPHNGFEKFIKEQVDYKQAGEILAKDYATWDEAMKNWGKSPTHKEVIDRHWCIYGTAEYEKIYVVHYACE